MSDVKKEFRRAELKLNKLLIQKQKIEKELDELRTKIYAIDDAILFESKKIIQIIHELSNKTNHP